MTALNRPYDHDRPDHPNRPADSTDTSKSSAPGMPASSAGAAVPYSNMGEMANGTGAGSGVSAVQHKGPDSSTPDADLMKRVVQSAHETVDRVADSAAPHVQRLEADMASAGELLKSRGDEMQAVSDELAEALRSAVRGKPLAALATALLIGAVIARLAR